MKEYTDYQKDLNSITDWQKIKIKSKYETLMKIINSSQKNIVQTLKSPPSLKEHKIDEEATQNKTIKKILKTFFVKNNKTNQYHINQNKFYTANTQIKIKELMNIYTEIKTDNSQDSYKDTIQTLLGAVNDYIIQFLKTSFIKLQTSFQNNQQYEKQFQEQFTLFKNRWGELPSDLQKRIKTHPMIQKTLFGFAKAKIDKVFERCASSKTIQPTKEDLEDKLGNLTKNQEKITLIKTTMNNMKQDIAQYYPGGISRNDTNFTIDNKVDGLIQTIDKDLQWYETYLTEQAKEKWYHNAYLRSMVEKRKEEIFRSYNWFDQTFKTQKYKDAMETWKNIVTKIHDGSAFTDVIKLRQIWIEDGKLKTITFDTLHSDGTFGTKGEGGPILFI